MFILDYPKSDINFIPKCYIKSGNFYVIPMKIATRPAVARFMHLQDAKRVQPG